MNFNEVRFLTSFGSPKQLPEPTRPEIAFSGHSNVGKSSMINALFNRKNLARTSAQPGKTATINFFDTPGAFIADLPGYGYAKRSKAELESWGELMDAYFTTGRPIALTVQIIDLRHEPTDGDYQMLDFLTQTGTPFIIVRTKLDKLRPSALAQRLTESDEELADFPGVPRLDFSAVTKQGLDELRKAVSLAVEGGSPAAGTR
ncbi:MAG: ribosome biogenesis GTP-binding protein YihA/YsxC [Clostridia bacterium]|nr:ribosome biogenesis GTP-binding protein YihA/YsxC [Clostridia bacterium]